MNDLTGPRGPECPNGNMDDGYAHDFDAVATNYTGKSLIYCRRCGDVRPLELPRTHPSASVTNITTWSENKPS